MMYLKNVIFNILLNFYHKIKTSKYIDNFYYKNLISNEKLNK